MWFLKKTCLDDNEVINYDSRLWVPNNFDLRKKVMMEAHSSTYSIHLGSTKIYKDLKKRFWWVNMKRDITDYVAKCLTYQQVKTKFQRPREELQPLTPPEWKWDAIIMDFVYALPRTKSGYDIIWVIVDRLTKFTHFIPLRTYCSIEKLA